jgi:tRNA(adenine34) deaminase
MFSVFSPEYFMQQALHQAEMAKEEDEVPVGAVIVLENKIIAKAYNQTEKLCDITAHAEIIAYSAASQFLESKYLPECTLYVTLEPCCMCAGMLKWAQFKKIVYGATDLKNGYQETGARILHPKTEVVGGVLEKECAKILTDYFKEKRG